mmetsp:Transcript_5769/g.21816  ORF Transcript_5769/g.21816 Transcript_5769/m.21816 type:complete len:92 (+) Transcript_5769:154-429(+)
MKCLSGTYAQSLMNRPPLSSMFCSSYLGSSLGCTDHYCQGDCIVVVVDASLRFREGIVGNTTQMDQGADQVVSTRDRESRPASELSNSLSL